MLTAKVKILTVVEINAKNATGEVYKQFHYTTDNSLIPNFRLFGQETPKLNGKSFIINKKDEIGLIYEQVDGFIKIFEIDFITHSTEEVDNTMKHPTEHLTEEVDNTMKHPTEHLTEEVDNTMIQPTEDTIATMPSKYMTITGNVFWAHVKEPNTKGQYPTNDYRLDLSIDDTHVIALQNLGVLIKNKGDERKNFVTCKSKNYQPKIFDADDQEITGSTIGNGSTAIITTSLYDNRPGNEKGGKKLLGLNYIKVLNLVVFEAKPLVG